MTSQSVPIVNTMLAEERLIKIMAAVKQAYHNSVIESLTYEVVSSGVTNITIQLPSLCNAPEFCFCIYSYAFVYVSVCGTN